MTEKKMNEFMEDLDKSAWKKLSEEFFWTEQMLEKYEDEVDWEEISRNRNILWTPTMLDKFKDLIDWRELSGISCFIWTEECLEQFKDYWDWSVLSGNEELKLNYQLIDKFADCWDWSQLINRWNSGDLYTIDFLKRYAAEISPTDLESSRLWEKIAERRADELKLQAMA